MVVLSASATPEIIRAALTAGARAFITKNVNPLDIPSAIRQAYEGSVYHVLASTTGPRRRAA